MMLKSMRGLDKLRDRMEELGIPHPNPTESRVHQPSEYQKEEEVVSEEEEGEVNDDYNLSMVSHDEKILPAVINKMKSLSQSQTIPEKSEIGDN